MKLVDSFHQNSLFPFLLLGNRLCIDFANTSLCPISKNGKLLKFQDLLFFYEITGVLSREETLNLQKITIKDPDTFEKIFHKSIAFRNTIQNILAHLVSDSIISSKQIKKINEILKIYEGYYILKITDEKFFLNYEYSNKNQDKLLVPIAYSLSQMLVDEDLIVRKCANPKCEIYFQDISPKKNRKWCSMDLCGNNSKARSFLERKKKRNHSSPHF